MPRYNPQAKSRIILDAKQDAYLVKHFRNTKNEILAENLGVSLRTMIRMARARGLEKSPHFIKSAQAEAAKKAKLSHLVHGTYPKKGVYSENLQKGKEFQFQTGRKEDGRKKKARVAKSAATMAKIRKEEKARILFGLPQKTKLNLKKHPTRLITVRYQLRKLGYFVPRGSTTAYYSEKTNRSMFLESKRLGDRGYVYMQFLPIEHYQSVQS